MNLITDGSATLSFTSMQSWTWRDVIFLSILPWFCFLIVLVYVSRRLVVILQYSPFLIVFTFEQDSLTAACIRGRCGILFDVTRQRAREHQDNHHHYNAFIRIEQPQVLFPTDYILQTSDIILLNRPKKHCVTKVQSFLSFFQYVEDAI